MGNDAFSRSTACFSHLSRYIPLAYTRAKKIRETTAPKLRRLVLYRAAAFGDTAYKPDQ